MLEEFWRAPDNATLFPMRVWRYLNTRTAPNEATPREVIMASWRRDGLIPDQAPTAEPPAIILNQAVLLAGINDSAAVLAALSERLVEIGVVPYYLHLLDRVQGTAAFEVDEASGRSLHEQLRTVLPGYAVPRLAREVPGEPAKVWLG
jgi:hypothetical protein